MMSCTFKNDNTCVHADVTFEKHTRVSPHQSNHESGSAVPLRCQAILRNINPVSHPSFLKLEICKLNEFKSHAQSSNRNDSDCCAGKFAIFARSPHTATIRINLINDDVTYDSFRHMSHHH